MSVNIPRYAVCCAASLASFQEGAWSLIWGRLLIYSVQIMRKNVFILLIIMLFPAISYASTSHKFNNDVNRKKHRLVEINTGLSEEQKKEYLDRTNPHIQSELWKKISQESYDFFVEWNKKLIPPSYYNSH